MSIQGLGSSASTASWVGAQLSREQARRSAEQLEAKAAALSAEAASARDEADTAQRRADELQTQAGQARTRAEIGKQAVASVRGMDRVAQTLSAAVGRLADAAEAGPSQGLGLQESGRIPAPTASSDLYTPAAGVRPALSVQPGQVVDLKV
ncbi:MULTISPECIES: hypothetical protein [Thauera]|jgi:hypothetical protein|uniref:Uncharacterized protein n=1 Tax=Thauera aminoaromatica S2 TaxID=1234381 RepID=N6XZC6_THASP|nr:MULTISPECIES: hypothetical protein [Thauera]ENO84610.1 hypothetical protein C665_12609 [Thauera aminoaromatica S2]KIN89800.1 hypothetical protein PO78_1731 [Thauera sp. SWB20]MCK6396893.1 hypothetical protein [Thauera aminoaromatica]HNB07852.1 hypothetical protein [Thauera aminoaromatica]HNV89530.1 hypothetical protein [Thauera aminoaromatica]